MLEVAKDAWEVVGWDCWGMSPSLMGLLLDSPLALPGSITNNAGGEELLAGFCGGCSACGSL